MPDELPPFNAVILGHQSAVLINYVTANPGIPPEIADLAGRLDYYQTNPSAFVPVPIPGGPPDNWPVVEQPPMWGGNRRSGDGGVPFFDSRSVACVPIPIPAGMAGRLEMGVAEYRTPPTIIQGWLSRSKSANPVGNLSFQEGSKVYPFVNIGTDVQPGETIYFLWRYWSSDLNAPSAPADQPQGATYGGGWPPLS